MPDAAEPTLLLPDVVETSIAALRRLADVAEAVEDEAQYVADLVAVYEARLRGWLADPGSAEVHVAPRTARAISLAIEEVGLVRDPHRAIDWLSTFPQVVGLALGRRP